MSNLSEKGVDDLVDALRRNFLYATPTPVVEDGKTVRYNLAMLASDYDQMMALIQLAGGFEMPAADRVLLAIQFAEKAKTASGEYDLSRWSMGELLAALDDTAGIEELDKFHAALEDEKSCRQAEVQKPEPSRSSTPPCLA